MLTTSQNALTETLRLSSHEMVIGDSQANLTHVCHIGHISLVALFSLLNHKCVVGLVYMCLHVSVHVCTCRFGDQRLMWNILFCHYPP